MSELPEGMARARPSGPVRSALGVLVRRAPGTGWEVLLGRRSRRSSFMPGHLALPGGRMDEGDEPDRHGALRRCASREVAEETGFVVSPEQWLDVGTRITPPIFPVRFDTRLFLAELPGRTPLPERPPSPGEIESLSFSSPSEVLIAWESGGALVPPPVLPVLRALASDRSEGLEPLAASLREINRAEERAPRIEFVPGIWTLPVESETLPPATHTNVWMPGAGSFVVIDPGSSDPGELRRLTEVVVRRARETGSRPSAIVLSHHHRDHIAGARELSRELGLPLKAHADVLGRLDAAAPGVASHELRDGDTLDLDGAVLRVLHTPGHAPGHLAFHLPERGALLAGDLVSGASTILIDPDQGDMGRYLESLRRVAALGCRTVLPSHGPPLPPESLERLIEHRGQRERRVLDALAGGARDLAGIAREAYLDLPEMPPPLTARQTTSHLLDLERRGQVRRRDPEGRRWERAAKA